MDWIPFARSTPEAPREVAEFARRLEVHLPGLDPRDSPDDGLKRRDIVARLGELMEFEAFCGGDFAAGEIDLRVPGTSVVLSAQAGRAHTNNGAIVATLAAAADPSVSALVLVLPERYKNGPTGANIHRQLTGLAAASRLRLELDGILLARF